MCELRWVLKWNKCEGSHKPRRPCLTQEEVDAQIKIGMARAAMEDETYRIKILKMYGTIPDWVPSRIRR